MVRIARENFRKQRWLGLDPNWDPAGGEGWLAEDTRLQGSAPLTSGPRDPLLARREGDRAELIAVILHSPQPPQEKSHEDLP